MSKFANEILTSFFPQNSAKVTCPEGWGEHFSGYCYLPIPEEQTWADAQSFCKDNNTAANLVTIWSDYENDFVREMASSMSDFVWIGLSDRFSEDDWIWVDGTASPYSQWNEGNQSNLFLSAQDTVNEWFDSNLFFLIQVKYSFFATHNKIVLDILAILPI